MAEAAKKKKQILRSTSGIGQSAFMPLCVCLSVCLALFFSAICRRVSATLFLFTFSLSLSLYYYYYYFYSATIRRRYINSLLMLQYFRDAVFLFTTQCSVFS